MSANAITREQLDEALGTAKQSGKKLGQILVEKGWVNEGFLAQTLSQQLSVPWVSLYHVDFSRQLLNRVPKEVAEKHMLIPVFVRHVKGQGETLYVAMDDPTNESALAELAELINLPVKPMIASESDIRSAIRAYYGTPADAPPASVAKPPLPPARQARKTVPDGAAAAAVARAQVASKDAASGDSPDADPEVSSKEIHLKKRPKMVALTLLDGTRIAVPAQKGKDDAEDTDGEAAGQPTARDLVNLLRAVAQGDRNQGPEWQGVMSALLALLLRKGLIADWEFVEEWNRVLRDE